MNENSTENILNYKSQAKNYLPNHLLHYFIEKDIITEIHFPILDSPLKPESMNSLDPLLDLVDKMIRL